MRAFEPTDRLEVASAARPPLSVAVPSDVVPLRNSTVPVGVPEPGLMADTVAVMNKGAIEQMGAPEALYDLPQTVFVANFLGQSNLFSGEVVGATDTAVSVDVGGARLVVPKARARRHNGAITVGVRPEKVSLHTEAPVASADPWTGRQPHRALAQAWRDRPVHGAGDRHLPAVRHRADLLRGLLQPLQMERT